MDLTALRAAFRSLADDAVTPYLWSDTDIDGYANATINDAVERGFLIEDDSHGSAYVTTTTQGVAGVTAEVQTITVDADAGTFTVTYGDQETSALAYNVSAAAMQSALEALSSVTPGDVVVTLALAVYTLTWANALGDVDAVTVDDSLLLNPVVDIAVIPGKASYTLDARVLKVTRARMHIRDQHLVITDKDSMDSGNIAPRVWWPGSETRPNWETTTGLPYALIETTGVIRLVGIPTQNDTLRLTVKRLPLADLSTGTDTPEIRAERHIDLLDGMLARAYLKNDVDTRNVEKAAEHEALFTRNFGPRIDAVVRTQQRTPRSHTTRINW